MSSRTPRDFTVSDLRKQLLNIEGLAVPSYDVVRKIVQEKFGLRFQKFDSANFRYKDPNYEEKRVWVSRLLSQFMIDGAIIISVDESCFKKR